MASNVTVVIATKGAKEAADDIHGIKVKAEETAGPLGKLGSTLGDIGKTAAGFALGAGLTSAAGFFADAAKAAAEDEQSTMRLQAAIRTLGGDYDKQIASVNAAIKAGQAKGFTDDDVRDSVVKLSAATGDSEEALKRLAIAQDLARGANIPLADASRLLGKVTDENLQVFKRMGITLPDVANEADVLAAVQAKFAGQSDAYAQSTAGQFAILQDRLSEAKETIGANLLPVMMKIGDVLANDVMPKVEAFANAVGPKLGQIGDYFATNIQPKIEAFVAWVGPKLEEFGNKVSEKFKDFQAYYESDLKPVLDKIKTAFQAVIDYVREHWDEIKAVVKPVIDEVVNIIQTGWGVVQGVFKVIIDLINGDWSKAWDDIKGIAKTVVDGVKDSLGNLLDFLQGLVSDFAKAGADLAGNLKDGIMGIDWWNVGAEIIRWAKQGIEDMAWAIIDSAKSIAGKIGDALNPKNWIGSPMGIQNWYPYYFEMGMENLAAQAESSPGLKKAVEKVKAQLAELNEKAQAAAADMKATLAGLPLGGYDGHASMSNGVLTLTGTPPNPSTGTMANFDVGAFSPVPLTAGQRSELGNRAYESYVNGNGPTATINLVVDGQVLAKAVVNQPAFADGLEQHLEYQMGYGAQLAGARA